MTNPSLKDVLRALWEWWPHRHGIFATEAMLMTVNAYIKSKAAHKAN